MLWNIIDHYYLVRLHKSHKIGLIQNLTVAHILWRCIWYLASAANSFMCGYATTVQHLKTQMGGSLWFKVRDVCTLSLHNTFGNLYQSHIVLYDYLGQTDRQVSNGEGQLSVEFAILKNILLSFSFLLWWMLWLFCKQTTEICV